MPLQNFSKVVADLYEAAERAAPDEYPDEVISIIRRLIDFDGAVLRIAHLARQTQCDAFSERVHVFNRDKSLLDDYAAIAAADPVTKAFTEHLTRPVAFDCKRLYAEAGFAALSRFAAKHDLHKVMLYHDTLNANGSAYAVVLCRAGDADFNESEGALLHALWSHVARAIEINLRRALHSVDPQFMRRALALVNSRGMIEIANNAMSKLLRLEWPECDARCLPLDVMSDLIKAGAYCGRQIEISASRKYGYMACIAKRIPRIEILSPSERNVADRFAKGMTHREIASHLHVSAHTVRNQIAHVYQKLGVHSKAELVRMMWSHHTQ